MAGGRKFFTMSLDDGVEQDKVIISLMKKSGIRAATFNINSGLFGKQSSVEYRGTQSIKDLPKSPVQAWQGGGVGDVDRIPADEIREVYEGFELASHTVHHVHLPQLSEEEIAKEIMDDKHALEKLTRYPVDGIVFPYGEFGERECRFAINNGFIFTRMVDDRVGHGAQRFRVPQNFRDCHPTCAMVDENVEDLLDEFLALDAVDEDLMFFMWGHAYEIEFAPMKKRGFLTTLERMLDKVACAEDVRACTNGELFRALVKK